MITAISPLPTMVSDTQKILNKNAAKSAEEGFLKNLQESREKKSRGKKTHTERKIKKWEQESRRFEI